MGTKSTLFLWGAGFFWGGVALGGAGFKPAPVLCVIGMILGVIWFFSLFSGGGSGESAPASYSGGAADRAQLEYQRAANERDAADEAHRAELARRAAERDEALRNVTRQQHTDDGWD